MKKLFYIFSIIAISSCWHAPEQVNYGSSNRDSNNLQTPDKLGVWVSGQTTIFTKIKVAKSLNTNVVRHTIFLPVFTGTDKVYNQFTDSGLLVALTVSNKKGFGTAPEPFRKDTANFRAELESLLSNLPVKPLYIALDNEENSLTYFTGSRLDYVPLLRIAVEVCHRYNIPCTNGGFASFGARFYATQKREGRALTLQAKRIDTLMQAYHTIDIDFLNVHIYSKLIGEAFKAGADFRQYVIEGGGRPVMTNETGVHTNDTIIAQKHLDSTMFVVESAIWFSGTRTQDVAVHDGAGNLTPVGEVIKNY